MFRYTFIKNLSEVSCHEEMRFMNNLAKLRVKPEHRKFAMNGSNQVQKE